MIYAKVLWIGGLKDDSVSYTDDGNLNMDKKANSYHKDNQELMIESVFITNTPIEEVIKAYIRERRKNGISRSDQSTECNYKSDRIVVPPKEDCL